MRERPRLSRLVAASSAPQLGSSRGGQARLLPIPPTHYSPTQPKFAHGCSIFLYDWIYNSQTLQISSSILPDRVSVASRSRALSAGAGRRWWARLHLWWLVSALPTTPTTTTRMAQVQGNNLLDVLKKKMRQTKEEMEKYKEESEDMARKLQVEIRRREEVSLRHQPTRPTWPTSVTKSSLQKSGVARKSVEASCAELPGAAARCCSGISCCCRHCWTLGGMSQSGTLALSRFVAAAQVEIPA